MTERLYPALKPKQALFVQEYLKDFNAGQAAVRSGYNRGSGSRLLTHPVIAKGIAAERGKLVKSANISAQRVLQEAARIAFGDLRVLFDERGSLKAIGELDDDAAATLASIEVKRLVVRRPRGEGEEAPEPEEIVKVKAWDKVRALELLAKHLGLLKEQMEHSGGISVSWEE